MARIHGKDLTLFKVDSTAGTTVSMLGNLIAINFELQTDMHETQTIGDDWKENTPGLRGGNTFTTEHFHDPVSTGTIGLENRYNHDAALTVKWSDGTSTKAPECLLSALSEPASVGDMMKVTATWTLSGTVAFA